MTDQRDQAAAPTGAAAPTHPEYLGVWCPICKQDCIPIRGRCGFCDTQVAERVDDKLSRLETVVSRYERHVEDLLNKLATAQANLQRKRQELEQARAR